MLLLETLCGLGPVAMLRKAPDNADGFALFQNEQLTDKVCSALPSTFPLPSWPQSSARCPAVYATKPASCPSQRALARCDGQRVKKTYYKSLPWG